MTIRTRHLATPSIVTWVMSNKRYEEYKKFGPEYRGEILNVKYFTREQLAGPPKPSIQSWIKKTEERVKHKKGW